MMSSTFKTGPTRRTPKQNKQSADKQKKDTPPSNKKKEKKNTTPKKKNNDTESVDRRKKGADRKTKKVPNQPSTQKTDDIPPPPLPILEAPPDLMKAMQDAQLEILGLMEGDPYSRFKNRFFDSDEYKSINNVNKKNMAYYVTKIQLPGEKKYETGKHMSGYKYFLEQCKKECSPENLMFYNEMLELNNKNANYEAYMKHFESIYQKFIKNGSKRWVNISGPQRTAIEKLRKKYGVDMFKKKKVKKTERVSLAISI